METAQDQLRRSKLQIKQLLPAGDFRRRCELVSDLALVAEASRIEGKPRKLNSSSQLSVYVTDERHLGATLLIATGSDKHIEQLRALAENPGMLLDEAGLHVGKKVVARTEQDIYHALGLPFIDPELREGRGEIALAQAGELPHRSRRGIALQKGR